MFSSLSAATPGWILAAVIVTIISLPAQASDPAAGTWELNLAKSKFVNVRIPKSQTRTYEVSGEQEKMIGKGIDAKGNETLFEFTANRDGKDYPYRGSPLQDLISLTTVDARTVNYTTKKAGKLATNGTRAVSADGKEMTISGKGTHEWLPSCENHGRGPEAVDHGKIVRERLLSPRRPVAAEVAASVASPCDFQVDERGVTSQTSGEETEDAPKLLRQTELIGRRVHSTVLPRITRKLRAEGARPVTAEARCGLG